MDESQKNEDRDNINIPANIDLNELPKKLAAEKSSALKYQKRRHKAINEIYEHYRNIVRVNRLTQRQAVNVPLMKETIGTIASKLNGTDDSKYINLDGEMDKEIIMNALWRRAEEDYAWEMLKRLDVKQALLCGRSHFVLNIDPSKEIPVTIGIADYFELLVDPKTKPWDIDTARYTVQTGMFKPLEEITNSDKYNKKAVDALKSAYGGNSALSKKNREDLNAKNERLRSIGVENIEDLEGYDKIVSIDGHITNLWDKEAKKYQRYYVVVADEKHILSADTLLNTIGADFLPYESASIDMDHTDYWNDGKGDLVLTPNKIINSWISGYFENRTLRTFGMNFYDTTASENWAPTQLEPRPFGWYGVPGKPSEVFQSVQIPDLSGTLEDIQFVVQMVERASATGAIEKGAVEETQRTLGEIQIAVGNAMKRTNDLQPCFNLPRQKLLVKWYELMKANATQPITLYSKGFDDKMQSKTVTPDEWVSENGYKVEITDKQSYLTGIVDDIQRLSVIQQSYPNNKALHKAIQKRKLRLADFTAVEIQEIQQEEEKNIEQGLIAAMNPQQAEQVPLPQQQPVIQ